MTLIKKIYMACGILGALAAFAMVHYDRINYFQERAEATGRESPAIFDTVILTTSLGLSVLFIPIGIAIGLGVGAVIHVALSVVRGYTRKQPWSG